jgi:nucleoside-diphosphate-sugar epimerase
MPISDPIDSQNGTMELKDSIIGKNEQVLVTGASGFIGSKVIQQLLEFGFRRIRCLTRYPWNSAKRDKLVGQYGEKIDFEVIVGNLLSREDCLNATKNVAVVYHLAAARGEKSFPDAFLNSVVTTRNLLDAILQHNCLKRFVNVSSFATYSNRGKVQGRLLDEICPVETEPQLRGDPYCFAKVKQDELVMEYYRQKGIPYVILKPGYVYGPGNPGITGRVGIDTFGVFLHMGGWNPVPLSYVDNCAEAIVLAGLKPGIDGEVFNVVDDDLPSSRMFLRLYKKNVRHFRSIFVPRMISYLFCYLWESYSEWSEGQLPPAFNRRRWHSEWKRTRFTNHKLKTRLDWKPRVSLSQGLTRHFAACREEKSSHA